MAHRMLGLPGMTMLRAHSTIPPLIASPAFPIASDIIRNLEALFSGPFGELLRSGGDTTNIWNIVIMFDEIAVEKRLRWDPKTNHVLGMCREHGTALELNTDEDVDVLVEELHPSDQGTEPRIHYASEATVGAVGILSGDKRIYSARPILISGTCKGKSLVSLTVKEQLSSSSPIYPLLCGLKFMNLLVGLWSLTADKDFRHVFKRLRNRLISRGVVIFDQVLTSDIIKKHLRDSGYSNTHIRSIFHPNDKQDVVLAYLLLRDIWSLQPALEDASPGYKEARGALIILGVFLKSLLFPYICVDLSLAEQLQHLSMAAHLALVLFRAAEKDFLPSLLFTDIMMMIKNVYFCAAYAKVDNPNSTFYIILLGTDRLESQFGIVRTMAGNDSGTDILQFSERATGSTEVASILAKYPQWDQSPRCLHLPFLDREGNRTTLRDQSDHVSPASWRGDTQVSLINLSTCWKKGLQILEQNTLINQWTEPHLHGLVSLGHDSGVDILSPCGTLLLSQALSDPEDREDDQDPDLECADDRLIPNQNHVIGAGFNTDMEDALYADMPSSTQKFDSYITLGTSGRQINKASFLSSRIHAHKSSTSTDRLKRYQGVPRYNPSSVPGDESALEEHSLIVSDPVVSLLKHEGLLFLCFGEVVRIDAGSQSVEHIAVDMLTEKDVYVTFQLLELIPATVEDDSTLKHDWRSRKVGRTIFKTRGRLILPVNPKVVISQNTNNSSFYLFESSALSALAAELVENLTVNDARSIPKAKESVTYFPYKLQNKACFLADTEVLRSEDIDEDCCPRCIPAVPLNYSNAQSIISHMAAHRLYDLDLKKYKQVCGLCLSTDGACRFYLKKGKGANSGYQVDFRASQGCPVMKKLKKRFKYTSAAQSTESSPCTNVPRRCPVCLDKSSPAIWTYDMKEHLVVSHPTADLSAYRKLWELTDFEKKKMEVVWDRRHEKKEKRNRKGKGKTALTQVMISDAHRSTAALQVTDLEGNESGEESDARDDSASEKSVEFPETTNVESMDKEDLRSDPEEDKLTSPLHENERVQEVESMDSEKRPTKHTLLNVQGRVAKQFGIIYGVWSGVRTSGARIGFVWIVPEQRRRGRDELADEIPN
ncbi:hypothetical protein K435DRAFT_791520 [Dendrothele bispora CBS 962.96]|uniref:Uncharacterized protein n=1 Tax=Dendrothele bispora (strain CBS 962.96) TaxID=1314807 RepID=A0A4S8MLS5_DENBC|nr:hypothetical protein K435DRAFT_791520 [Dendrothele bispora CBS 962.96]